VLLEKYGPDFTQQHTVKASRPARRDVAASGGPQLDRK